MFDGGVGSVRRMLWYSRASWERQLGIYGDDVEIRQWACENGYVITEALFENGAGGLQPVRALPQLSQAIARIEAGEVHALGVIRQDRLCCDPGYLRELLERVWAVGGEVWSYEEGRFVNDAERILEYMELACDHAQDRIRAQLRRVRGKRRHIGHRGYHGGLRFGGREYGFQPEVPGRPRRPIPAEQAVIREMCAACPDGKGYAAFAEVLNTRGEPTVTEGRRWSGKTVRDCVLRGPARPTVVTGVQGGGRGSITVGPQAAVADAAETGA